jgi:hypothetical protein
MEMWILIALFLIGFGFAVFGFVRRSFPAAIVGAIVLICAGAILYTDGYNSYVQCVGPNCTEITSFTYDTNSNLTRVDMNVFKMNAHASQLSGSFGLMGIFGGCFLAIIALFGKLTSGN